MLAAHALTSIISCETYLLSCSYVRNFTCMRNRTTRCSTSPTQRAIQTVTSVNMQITHRLVGHDADAVGEVASHHATNPLCLRHVSEPLPHTAVDLHVGAQSCASANMVRAGILCDCRQYLTWFQALSACCTRLLIALDLHQDLQPLQRRHRCARPACNRGKKFGTTPDRYGVQTHCSLLRISMLRRC